MSSGVRSRGILRGADVRKGFGRIGSVRAIHRLDGLVDIDTCRLVTPGGWCVGVRRRRILGKAVGMRISAQVAHRKSS